MYELYLDTRCQCTEVEIDLEFVSYPEFANEPLYSRRTLELHENATIKYNPCKPVNTMKRYENALILNHSYKNPNTQDIPVMLVSLMKMMKS